MLVEWTPGKRLLDKPMDRLQDMTMVKSKVYFRAIVRVFVNNEFI